MTRRTTYRQTTDDRFTYRTRIGSGEWAVHVDHGDADRPTLVGYVRQNGSRLRDRSWSWKTTTGVEGRSSSRRFAAEAIAREVSA